MKDSRPYQPPGRVISVEGGQFLFFSGFSYLGMSINEQFLQWVAEGVRLYGTVHPSSRISNTRMPLYEILEAELSSQLSMPDTACFSSGYLAAQAAVCCAAQQSQLLPAPFLHPSLRLPGMDIPTISGEAWLEQVIEQVNEAPPGTFTIVMESVRPLSGKVMGLEWLKQLTKPVSVLIDDSHGIGILGAEGQGITALLPRNPLVTYVVCYSLAKAYSIQGGGVSGPMEFIDSVKKLPGFTAATSLSPGFAHAWLQAGDLFRTQRTRLMENIQFFRTAIHSTDILFNDARLPVFVSRTPHLYEYCHQRNCLLSSFSYPAEDDPRVTRIILNALHEKEDISTLADMVNKFI